MHPFHSQVSDGQIEDLRLRLARTRWPEAEPVDDWSQGVPLAWLQSVCEYWGSDYDWRRCEQKLNSFAQFVTEIDGVGRLVNTIVAD